VHSKRGEVNFLLPFKWYSHVAGYNFDSSNGLLTDSCFRAIVLIMNVTLKINDPLLKSARHRAVDQGLSLSAWMAKLIEREVGAGSDMPAADILTQLGDETLADIPLEIESSRELPREIEW